jgi:hypothetical protein
MVGHPSWNSAARGEGYMGDEQYKYDTNTERRLDGSKHLRVVLCRMDGHLGHLRLIIVR